MSAPSTIPHYRALAPTFLKQWGTTAASYVPTGADVFYEGEPTLDLMPRNAAAVTAKANSLPTIDLSGPNQREILRLAASLGFQGGSLSAASAFVEAWSNDPEIPE